MTRQWRQPARFPPPRFNYDLIHHHRPELQALDVDPDS